jgi:hypothetical protein
MGSLRNHAEPVKAKYCISKNGSGKLWSERADFSTPKRIGEAPNGPFPLQALLSMTGGRDDSASKRIAHSILQHRLLQTLEFAGASGSRQTNLHDGRMLIAARAVALCVLLLIPGVGCVLELCQPISLFSVGKLESRQSRTLFTTPVIYPYFDWLEVDLTAAGPADPLASREPTE